MILEHKLTPLCGLELELHDRRPHNCPSVDETPCADPNVDAVVIDWRLLARVSSPSRKCVDVSEAQLLLLLVLGQVNVPNAVSPSFDPFSPENGETGGGLVFLGENNVNPVFLFLV